jgi:hypothetical protein
MNLNPQLKATKTNNSNLYEDNPGYGYSQKPDYRPEGVSSTAYGINNSNLSSASAFQNKSG